MPLTDNLHDQTNGPLRINKHICDDAEGFNRQGCSTKKATRYEAAGRQLRSRYPMIRHFNENHPEGRQGIASNDACPSSNIVQISLRTPSLRARRWVGVLGTLLALRGSDVSRMRHGKKHQRNERNAPDQDDPPMLHDNSLLSLRL
ncbi:hypothetical protein AD946_06760 [Gluconobacter thailandicus]|nr:hypothetical protein AD946_06760 [Gluconobacter thailandicus]